MMATTDQRKLLRGESVNRYTGNISYWKEDLCDDWASLTLVNSRYYYAGKKHQYLRFHGQLPEFDTAWKSEILWLDL